MSSAELNCSVSLVRRLICYTDVDRWSKVNWFSTGQFNSVQQLHSRGPANMKLCEPSEWTVSRDEISYGKSLLKEHIVTQHEYAIQRQKKKKKSCYSSSAVFIALFDLSVKKGLKQCDCWGEKDLQVIISTEEGRRDEGYKIFAF